MSGPPYNASKLTGPEHFNVNHRRVDNPMPSDDVIFLPYAYNGPNGRENQVSVFQATSSATSINPYSRYSAGGSSSSYGHSAAGLSHYGSISDDVLEPIGTHVDYRRMSLKRKIPSTQPTYVGNFVSQAGSSSVPPRQLQYGQPHYVPTTECRPPGIPSNVTPNYWRSHCTAVQDGPYRNVRARYDSNFSLEPAPTMPYNVHAPSHAGRSVLNHSIPVHFYQAPSSSASTLQLSHTAGGTSGNTGNFMAFAHGPLENHAAVGHNSYAERASTHEIGIDYRSAHPCTSVRLGVPLPPEVTAPSRRPRHVPTEHGSSSRRTRNSYSSFHPILFDSASRRWNSEPVGFMEAIYESRAAFDPHWDMRLDVDNMTYEELLALGEQIGNVNTGLAGETISSCLTKVICGSRVTSGVNIEPESCTICLEECKEQQSLGKMRCDHSFHWECISQWLQVKSLCPVCKASALEERK